MKKLVLTVLTVMMSTDSTHTISAGAVAGIIFIPIAVVTGVIVHKNNQRKHERKQDIQEQEALVMDLKEYKKERKDQKLQLRRLEAHNQENSIEATEHRSKIQELTLEIEDLEDRIEALN